MFSNANTSNATFDRQGLQDIIFSITSLNIEDHFKALVVIHVKVLGPYLFFLAKSKYILFQNQNVIVTMLQSSDRIQSFEGW